MNWQQLTAILWLRWRLSRNQFIKAGSLSAILSVLVLVMIGAGAILAGFGGLAAGIAAGKAHKPRLLLFICDGATAIFLFVWLIGLLSELQRVESIDLSRLLHFPISLKQVFLFNYAVSHATPAIILFAPFVGGFCMGVAITGGLRLVLLGLVFATVLFAITAWTYCIRGWLSSLMANRRRARSIAAWVTVVIILVVQLPNLIVHLPFMRHQTHRTSGAKNNSQVPELFFEAHPFVPPAWPGYAAMKLAERSYLPALAFSATAALVGIAGLRRAYSMTLRYYTGATSGGRVKPDRKDRAPAAQETSHPRGRLVDLQIPGLRQDVAGLALGTLQCLLRAPELKLALLMPVIAMCVGFGSIITRVRHVPNPEFVPFVMTMPLFLLPFMLAPTMSNVFGLDRGGFRSLVLSPVPRYRILLGKNLAFVPFVAVFCLLVLVVTGVVYHVGLFQLLTGMIQGALALILFAHVANWLAILAPYRYSLNRLKAKKFKPITLVSALASMIVAPVVVLVVAIPVVAQFVWNRFELPSIVPVNVISGLLLLALACAGYWLALPAQGRLLQKREVNVLLEVTSELE